MLLTALYILPITGEPIVNGAVLVRDGKICDIGDSGALILRYGDNHEVRDFGNAAIMPGLVDLHTHLENGVLHGMVPDQPYVSAIAAARAASKKLDTSDWQASAVFGALEALSAGITCVGDISATGASCDAMARTGLRGTIFREVGAVDHSRVDDAIRSLQADIDSWQQRVDSESVSIGIAPREAFVCHPAIYSESARVARENNLSISLSMAASREEYDFIRWGSSTLSVESEAIAHHRGYVEMPPWLPTSASPVVYFQKWGAFDAPNVIAAHCIHVDGEDIRKLQEYNVAVAICPRTNAQLSMGVAPLREFLRSEMRVGLGSGHGIATSAADIMKEMRIGLMLNRATNPGHFIDSSTMLRLATIDGARALGLDHKIGSLEIGKSADITVVDLSDSRQALTEDPGALVVNSRSASDTLMTMVGGVIRYEKEKWSVDLELAKDIARVIEIRGKLRM